MSLPRGHNGSREQLCGKLVIRIPELSTNQDRQTCEAKVVYHQYCLIAPFRAYHIWLFTSVHRQCMFGVLCVNLAIVKLQVQSKPLQNLEMPKDKCFWIQTRNRSEESYLQYIMALIQPTRNHWTPFSGLVNRAVLIILGVHFRCLVLFA